VIKKKGSGDFNISGTKRREKRKENERMETKLLKTNWTQTKNSFV